MAFCEMHYFSPSLGMQTAANIILPEGKGPGPFPVFYLLHGLSDDHTIWSRRTSIERYVADLPLIVVMPNGGRGFYVDAVEGFAGERAIIQDLIGFVDGTFHTIAERSGRCIGGLSMGGYGALRLALGNPDIFCSAASHSGALAFGHRNGEWEGDRAVEFARILGSTPKGGFNDLFAITERTEIARLPHLRIDCGVDDFLIEDNREFHHHLKKIGVPHEYAEYPGAHSWDYWDIHVREVIAFHAKNLGLTAG